MSFPSGLKSLVERFRNNRSDYRSNQYNETQARREFIDPLLELLGWDVANKQGYAEFYKNVVHEDRIKIGGSSKAPDYSFRIGSTRKFFLEAKKPAINIEVDADSAYQLRRYAWSAKLPLSVLTNFDTFVVYDCRVRPERGDKPSTARILAVGFEEYESRWSEISDIFSFEAINKGGFDRFADDAKVRKGTTAVDDDFLAEIERWRDLLARAILRKNASITSFELNDAVQKTIDRIVFLRIAEDRGIEPEGQLKGIAQSADVYRRLGSYFRQADARYNSGLFHFKPGDGSSETLDKFTLTLAIEDKPLRDIISNLYPPLSPYEFSFIPADILGQVYERFLARVIRVKGRSIEIDEKPEIKKAGGVYYTPTFVVRYIVARTLRKLLENKIPSQVAGEEKGQETLKIVDPACGSGSFLIEAYQCLLDWYLQQYVSDKPERHAKGKHSKLYLGPGGAWRLTIAERKRILTTHIYGVDVDSQAVEVTKLSLLLKVLEGESNDVVASQINFLEHQRVLPDLGANIKCGNSLIDEDFYGLFDPSSFSHEQQHKVNVFSWANSFPSIFASGGFDVVIGNPPYGADFLPQEKSYLEAKFPHQTYQLDSYLLFVEQSIALLLKEGGEFGMIIPNPWLTNILQTKIRNHLFTATRINEVVHFDFPVFRKARATVDTEIVLFTKGFKKKNQPVANIVSAVGPTGTIDSKSTVISVLHDQDMWAASASNPVNIFLDANHRNLAEKIKKAGQPLALHFQATVGMKPYQVGKGKPKQSRSDVENRVFDADKKVDKDYRQYLRGGDITKFSVAPLERRYIKYGEWLAEPRLSARFDTPVKIVMRQTGDSLIAACDRKKFLCMNNMHVLVPNDATANIYFYLGLLNSRLLNWYYQTLNPEMGEALAEVKKTNIERLPIPSPKAAEQEQIAHLAETIESLVGIQLATRDEASLRVNRNILERSYNQLNQAVYDLFQLNETEQMLVDASQSKHGLFV